MTQKAASALPHGSHWPLQNNLEHNIIITIVVSHNLNINYLYKMSTNEQI